MNTECRNDVFVSVLNRAHSGGANATTITTIAADRSSSSSSAQQGDHALLGGTVATLHNPAQRTVQATRLQAASNRSGECHHPTCAWDKQGGREHGGFAPDPPRWPIHY